MNIKQNYNLASNTFFKVGGKVDYYAEITSVQDLSHLKQGIDNYSELPKLVLGACSNILISDKGFAGVVIKNAIKELEIKGKRVKIGAGEMLPVVSRKIAKIGLAGFEHLANIPGTVGGAIRGNAEAYRQSISDHLINVNWCDFSGVCQNIDKNSCQFGYRESIFKNDLDGKGMIVGAEFELSEDLPEILLQTIKDDTKKRLESQPKEWSCGCFFKNIELDEENYTKINKEFGTDILKERKIGDKFSAGLIIDKLGLKGLTVGGAMVSPVHANFIVNTGKATSQDIYDLYLLIKDKVLDLTGIEMKNEVILVGDF